MKEKEISIWQDIKLTSRLLSIEKSSIGPLITFALLSGILYLTIPLATQTIVNSLAFTTARFPIFVLSGLVLILLIFSGMLRLFQKILAEYIQERYIARISHSAIKSLFNPKEFDRMLKYQTKTIWANHFFEILTFTKNLNVLALDGLTLVLQAVIGLLILSFYHPYLFIFAFFMTIGLLLLIYLPSQSIHREGIRESEEKYETADFFEQIASVKEGFNGGHAGPFLYEKLNTHLAVHLRARRSQFKSLLKQEGGFVFLQATMNALLLALGGWLVLQQQLTLGQLVAAELILNSLLGDFSKISKVLESGHDLIVSANKLKVFAPRLMSSEPVIEPNFENLIFSQVTVRFLNSNETIILNKGDQASLEMTSFDQKKRIHEALTGENQYEEFQVEFDKIPSDLFLKNRVLGPVCYLQTPFLVKGTIEENLSLFRRERSSSTLTRDLYQGGELIPLISKLDLKRKIRDFQSDHSFTPLVSLLRGLLSDAQLIVIDEDFIANLGKRASLRLKLYEMFAKDKIIIELSLLDTGEKNRLTKGVVS